MRFFRSSIVGAVGVACALAVGVAFAQSTITNFQPNSGWQNVSIDGAVQPATLVAGWTSSSSLMLADVGGDQFLLIDGGETVTYTLSGLISGQSYLLDLSFKFAGYRNPLLNPGQNSLRISNDQGLPNKTVDENLAESCNDNHFGCRLAFFDALTRKSPNYPSSFVASGTSIGLTFEALGNGNHARVGLDNVRVTVTAVPEPETYALLLAGLGAIGMRTRRRQPNRG